MISSSTLSSLPLIASLNQEIFSPLYPWPPFSLEDYKKRLAHEEPLILVAKNGEDIIADSIGFKEDDVWYIWVLGVHKNHRGKGIGSTLYEMNEDHARKQGLKKVRIKIYAVSKDMLRLANKRGYAVKETVPNNDPLYTASIVELDL